MEPVRPPAQVAYEQCLVELRRRLAVDLGTVEMADRAARCVAGNLGLTTAMSTHLSYDSPPWVVAEPCPSKWADTIPCMYEAGHSGTSVPHCGPLPAVDKPYAHECFVTWSSETGPLIPRT